MAAGPPDRMIMIFPDLSEVRARYLADTALSRARQQMPRVTGMTAARLSPIWGRRWFGLYFPDRYVWYLEHGTNPRTMASLAGKVIPMWINDPDGSTRRDNPKAKTRRTDDGRTQVLIFRKAAPLGRRKTTRTRNKDTGAMTVTTTPASYPGAPGRIGARNSKGQIASGNVGVRWRHPGLRSIQFLNSALAQAAFEDGLIVSTVYAVDSGSLGLVIKTR